MRITKLHRPRESKLIATKHRILNQIFREGSCSRFSLARRLNINASTIGNYVEDFLGRGVLLERHTGPTRRGRSPVPVWLNPEYGCFLGVDLEALRVRTVLTDFAGGTLAQHEVGLRAGLGRDAVLDIVLDAARETARRERGDDLSLHHLVAAAEAGDQRIRDLLEQVGRDLGWIAANLANLFAPEKIILAGAVPSACALVRRTLEHEFRRHTLTKKSWRTRSSPRDRYPDSAGPWGPHTWGSSRPFPKRRPSRLRPPPASWSSPADSRRS